VGCSPKELAVAFILSGCLTCLSLEAEEAARSD